MTASTILLNAASGTGDPLFVENVFSTFVYDGTNSNNHSINNGIDLSGEGGLVWIKSRDVSRNHALYDTERGVNKYVSSNTVSAQTDLSSSNDQGVKAFNSNGFTMDDDALVNANDPGFVSWTFRKDPNFFDIQTYTGDGSSTRTLSHNLTTDVGMVLIKGLNETESWQVYHRSIATGYIANLNTTSAATNLGNSVNHVSGGTITLTAAGNPSFSANDSGVNYVAYIFAHNDGDGGYGDGADQDIIKCGTYQSDGAAGEISVDLGFEAQFVMVKAISTTGNWHVQDIMRGMAVGSTNNGYLQWNTTDTTSADGTAGGIVPTSNGFRVGLLGDINIFNATQTYIYMAIRRGPMATPTAASDVFSIVQNTNTLIDDTVVDFGITPDMHIANRTTTGMSHWNTARLTGGKYLFTNATSAEGSALSSFNEAQTTVEYTGQAANDSGTYLHYGWKRAPGYFDVFTYTGDGTGTRTVAHNLGVVPEMMWLKKRSTTSAWYVYHKDLSDPNNGYIELDKDAVRSGSSGAWGTGPTSTNFQGVFNTSSQTHVVYLFATLAGVSKVGSVSHSGSSTDVDCGFSAGSKFVLLKRTDSSGDWYAWDSTQGIVSGNDPYLLLSTADASVTNTDLIDPLSSGFTITDDFTDGTYLFYAIAA